MAKLLLKSIGRIPVKIGVSRVKFDGKVSANLNIHLFFFDITFEANTRIIE